MNEKYVPRLEQSISSTTHGRFVSTYHWREKEWEGAYKDLEDIHITICSAPYLELCDITWSLRKSRRRWCVDIRDRGIFVNTVFFDGTRPFITITKCLLQIFIFVLAIICRLRRVSSVNTRNFATQRRTSGTKKNTESTERPRGMVTNQKPICQDRF